MHETIVYCQSKKCQNHSYLLAVFRSLEAYSWSHERIPGDNLGTSQ